MYGVNAVHSGVFQFKVHSCVGCYTEKASKPVWWGEMFPPTCNYSLKTTAIITHTIEQSSEVFNHPIPYPSSPSSPPSPTSPPSAKCLHQCPTSTLAVQQQTIRRQLRKNPAIYTKPPGVPETANVGCHLGERKCPGHYNRHHVQRSHRRDTGYQVPRCH
jgi:hypothetical protein